MITIHSHQDFLGMRTAGACAAGILEYIEPFVVPGVTTETLNRLCHDKIISGGAIPAPLNYRGFPKSICTSVNHVVCHGIPTEQKVLFDGDIINIDVTVIVEGWYGDCSKTYCVGKKTPIRAQKLVAVTYDAMMFGIEAVKPGEPLSAIGRAIQTYAESQGFTVVRDYCGHGIGKVFHAAPNILHYYDAREEALMQPGMFFTIEPMINAGGYETKLLKDGWTAVTKDHSLSAQFEHTIGVTESGYEIFTLKNPSKH